MKCSICGNECGAFKVCFTCHKRWSQGEILTCAGCKSVMERSKYDEYLCPGCFVYREKNLGHELPPNPYAKFQTKRMSQEDDVLNARISAEKMKNLSEYYKKKDKKEQKRIGMKRSG